MKRPPFDPTFAQGGLFDQPAHGDAKKTSMPNEAARPLQVSEAAQLVGDQVAALGKLSIQGEVSGYRGSNNSGHLYFSIKDAQCVLPCVVWKSKASSIKIALAEGAQVVVEGRFNYYAEGGKLSFIVDSIRATGQGDLDAKFRLLCAQLKELGYFEESRKRALPMLPRGIAIITSASGAALQDCLAVAARKFPSVAITVIDVVVQGASAAAAVSNAIHVVDLAAKRMGIDVILVTRGGGSREDLDAFNHRLIADAVYNCTTPIVAAIGHESDTSIIELVADLRASTPTAAMNRILPDRDELRQQLDYANASLRQSLLQFCQTKSRALTQVSSRPCLRDPAQLLLLPRNRLAHLNQEFQSKMLARIDRARRTTLEMSSRLETTSPAAMLGRSQAKAHATRHRLDMSMNQVLARARRDVQAIQAQLQAVGPQGTLARGYSITKTSDGKLVRSVANAKPGDVIHTILADGALQSRIEKGG
ncbi:MAG: exodeoxyribonuclease VII large subunit [Phycisphaerales bacterium]|nr:exodeoxyribonuclease VII large subunit [Phycisphaerales bacterium]